MDSGEQQVGTFVRNNGKFGFIKVHAPQDGQPSEMFVMPAACKAFSMQLPRIGTVVRYRVVKDAKTDRPRAEDVEPEDTTADMPGVGDSTLKGEFDWLGLFSSEIVRGTMQRDCGKYGFIHQDDGTDMFVMPVACTGFGHVLPHVGTRLQYSIVTDEKTGRPRAENVVPCEGEANAFFATPSPGGHGSDVWGSETYVVGTMHRINGNFGFIKQDDGSDMFVMPAACQAFDGLPAVGTRVKFSVVTDAKTGRPRAEDVRPLAPTSTEISAWHSESPEGENLGTMCRLSSSYGFITRDDGTDMFVMPKACAAFGGELPAVGTRVKFSVVTDAKTGRPRAECVRPAGSQSHAAAAAAAAVAAAMPNASSTELATILRRAADELSAPCSASWSPCSASWHDAEISAPGGRHHGEMARLGGKFGFIAQDDGTEMFVLPGSCTYWGRSFPPIGTRVTYTVVKDEKTGRLRAEDVLPESGSDPGPGYGAAHRPHVAPARWSPYGRSAPPALPSPGAADWAIGGGLAWDGAPWGSDEVYVGTVSRVKETFGFITPDSGGDDMFVMPNSCSALGGAIPPIGMRVRYKVVIDSKTGRCRADEVQAE